MKAIKLLFVFALLFMFSYAVAIPKLVGTFAQAGHSDWNTADETLTMTALSDTTIYTITLDLPAGTYVYKVLDGTAWTDPNYPGNDQTFILEAQSSVTWYCNRVAHLVMHNDPIIAGNFLSEMGGVDWDPTNGMGAMAFQSQATMTYTWQGLIPAGTYEFKVTLNHNWDQNTTTNNIPFVSDGTTETLITYNFYTNIVTTSAGAPPSATITFMVDDSAGQTHTALYLKGTWNSTGYYDPSWANGAEHITLVDDGTNGDVTAGDHIFTGTQSLVTDAGANTWSWGVNDENHTWIDAPYATFTLPTADPQTLTAVILGGTTQDVTVTFQVNMASGDASVYAGGISVQGNVLPLDWTSGSHMLSWVSGDLYTVDLTFPTGSIRNVQYKFGAFGADSLWTWETYNGNHAFVIDDQFSTQVLPAADFFAIANNDPMTSVPTLKLSNNPNPFIGTTSISYETAKRGATTIEIFNLKGQLVRTLVADSKDAGTHKTMWDSKDNDGRNVASGIYVYKLKNDGHMVGKKMILLK